ncbi:uncharacterized protein HMPREF1541_09890 [Cyphellophora europaea CBS 101466]|uniref:Endonuclease/exonuclease/phosphatase domain-containing protein n=1 Tax=Cyphellophora europaea (strain CBS 101466) TaxID=1220924 RepID=W2SAT3_CYPE1|nr:uncharacterized protein HMPREF1541_09890 [Cyphellophora europaea CBS 101466]ETN45014.1 hypothetical protein HMPREF1541_09890 [Cyphellophora europaea CBS 101466]
MHLYLRSIIIAGLCLGLAEGAVVRSEYVPRGEPNTAPLRFLTWNIRWDEGKNVTESNVTAALVDGMPPVPKPYYAGADVEKPWTERGYRVANDILFNAVDFFGGQEVSLYQQDTLLTLLGDGYTTVGNGKNGRAKSGYPMVFYKKAAAKLNTWDTFFLSQTPFEKSKYNGTSVVRAVVTAKFTTPSGNTITLVNTHLDHKSEDARRYGASLMLHRAKFEFIKTGGKPVVLLGDFNSNPDSKNNGAYQIMTGSMPPVPLNATFLKTYNWTAAEEQSAGMTDDFHFEDLMGATPARYRSGHFSTTAGSAAACDPKGFHRIDFIMACSIRRWTPKAFRVGENLYDDGVRSR